MTHSQQTSADRQTTRLLLSGIPFIIFFGALTHFLFDWSNQAIVMGLFVPVNESVWEHLKMSFWPTIVWFLSVHLFPKGKHRNSASGLLLAAAAALFVCPLIIVTLFYTAKAGFGIESLWLDGLLFFLGISLGQAAAIHVYRYAERNPVWIGLAAGFILLFMGGLFLFTFWQPHLPLFLDTPSGTYGF